MAGGGGGRIKQNANDWKFQTYTGTNLGYDMRCDSVKSYHEEKEGDLLNGNCIINLKNLITNIDNFLVCKECAQERELQIKLEEERYLEKFIDYVNYSGVVRAFLAVWGRKSVFLSYGQ